MATDHKYANSNIRIDSALPIPALMELTQMSISGDTELVEQTDDYLLYGVKKLFGEYNIQFVVRFEQHAGRTQLQSEIVAGNVVQGTFLFVPTGPKELVDYDEYRTFMRRLYQVVAAADLSMWGQIQETEDAAPGPSQPSIPIEQNPIPNVWNNAASVQAQVPGARSGHPQVPASPSSTPAPAVDVSPPSQNMENIALGVAAVCGGIVVVWFFVGVQYRHLPFALGLLMLSVLAGTIYQRTKSKNEEAITKLLEAEVRHRYQQPSATSASASQPAIPQAPSPNRVTPSVPGSATGQPPASSSNGPGPNQAFARQPAPPVPQIPTTGVSPKGSTLPSWFKDASRGPAPKLHTRTWDPDAESGE